MWLSYLRVCGALAVTLLSGSYYFVQLRGVCGPTSLTTCISVGADKSIPTKTSSEQPPVRSADGGKAAQPRWPGVMWPQTPASEELLIWGGYLDGEVGRISVEGFQDAVRAYQITLVPPMQGDEQQRAALQKRVSKIQNSWRFEKEIDPEADVLWLPRKLLPNRQELSHGSRYQSNATDFSVDVAEWDAGGLTIEIVKANHCCRGARTLERPIIDTSDAGGPGFMLSAREGSQRVSVRAQQRNGVIRILAIAYDMAKDKEFRILRNAIASNYAAFAPAPKTRRTSHVVLEDRHRSMHGENNV